MNKFLKLYEEENQEENILTIENFNETIEKLKEVFNNTEPVQTAGVLLLDIIGKIVNDSDQQQDLIDAFQDQLETALETAETESTHDIGDGDEAINFDEKFQEMNDEDDDFESELEVSEEPIDDSFMLDDVETNSKDEKFKNIKELLKPEEKSKKKAEKKSDKKDKEDKEEK